MLFCLFYFQLTIITLIFRVIQPAFKSYKQVSEMNIRLNFLMHESFKLYLLVCSPFNLAHPLFDLLI